MVYNAWVMDFFENFLLKHNLFFRRGGGYFTLKGNPFLFLFF